MLRPYARSFGPLYAWEPSDRFLRQMWISVAVFAGVFAVVAGALLLL